MRPQQTQIRNQGKRDTCTVFATTAAVEAAYKKWYGLELDLSEQYLNHVQKSHWFLENPLPLPETQPETNGGGKVSWQMTVLGRYGIPPETTLPYISDGAWQAIENWEFPTKLQLTTDQRALGDFMLSATPVTYKTPTEIRATVLPQAALEAARYRPTSVKQAASADLQNLAWYKSELEAGREVAFMVNLSGSRPPPANGEWDPGIQQASHAMLMVGFDDAKRVFWVKNSWGEASFVLFSYDWVTRGAVFEAATILSVASPDGDFDAQRNMQLFIGRWNLDHDGWQGTLDIHRLPGNASPSDPERRLGTYFGPDGIARRVNGAISGNRMDFYIDWNTPNLPATALQGMHFVTYVYDKARTSMAGYMIDTNGNRWSVTAQKGGWVTGVPRSGSGLAPAAYSGRWSLDTDGTVGLLALQASDAGALSGTFTDDRGLVAAVSGEVASDPRFVTFRFVQAGTVRSYSGYLNGRARGIMAGAMSSVDGTFGFHAARSGEL